MSKKVGIIDIGTNTVLCLKAAIAEDKIDIISDNRYHYRAGRRLDDAGNISFEYRTGLRRAVLLALNTLGDCSEIKIVATEVLRKPKDGLKFAGELALEIGREIKVIDSQEEASFSFNGATYDLETWEDRIAVIDVGGGSTELAVGIQGELKAWSGVKLGAVTACEKVGYESGVDEYLRAADEIFASSDFNRFLKPVPDRMLIVGGSAVSLAAILAGSKSFEPEKIQGFKLMENDLFNLLKKLASMPLSERKKLMTFDPERADIIVGGGAIILSFIRNFGFDFLNVSIYGLRHGLLTNLYGERNS
jgi:exopolyphosphatase/guanosine-5'-triphosphate,3'-diphosphate pyrophosphatase